MHHASGESEHQGSDALSASDLRQVVRNVQTRPAASSRSAALQNRACQKPVEARHVLSAIAVDEPTRGAIVARFKAAGASLDRWQLRDREVMAEAITKMEDELELAAAGRSTFTREALRTIRRRLEEDVAA